MGQTRKETAEEHVDELAELARTFGLTVLEKEIVHIRAYDGSTLIPSGKLETLIEKAKLLGATLIVFDDEIAPSQQRNLEKAFGITVMDRTELIWAYLPREHRLKKPDCKSNLPQ